VKVNLDEVREYLDTPHKDLSAVGKHIGQLELLQQELNDVAQDLPWAVVRELRDPLNDMLLQLSNIQTELALGRVARSGGIRPGRVRTGARGPPLLDIDMQELLELYHDGYTYKEIAEDLGVAISTVHNRLRKCGLGSNRFSVMNMEQLRQAIYDVYKQGSGAQGYRMVVKHLAVQGIHVPQDVVMFACSILKADEIQLFGNRTIVRRRYRVPFPNSLWHFDGHHKLIRWKFVIHGCIDGFSRRVIWLAVKNNNRAETVAELFDDAIEIYGVPSRVRCDHGGENVLVGQRMEEIRGVKDPNGELHHETRVCRVNMQTSTLSVCDCLCGAQGALCALHRTGCVPAGAPDPCMHGRSVAKWRRSYLHRRTSRYLALLISRPQKGLLHSGAVHSQPAYREALGRHAGTVYGPLLRDF
jgi:predicted DNA-binding protein YlxM (UPF0122 family)